MDRRPPFSGPFHLGDQVIPSWQGASKVPLGQLDKQCSREFVYPFEGRERQRRAELAGRDTDQAVQPLVAASLVPVEMTRRVEYDGSPPSAIGVHAQRCLLGHGP